MEERRVKELSFQWPHHAVDLVERTVERVMEVDGASVVCVAKSESKTFIAFKVFQEFWLRNMTARKMVLLVDDENAEIVKPFVSGITNQSMLSVKTYFAAMDVTDGVPCTLSSCDIIVTTGKAFLQILKAGIMDLTSFSLIVFDKCHLAFGKEHPFAIILKQVERCTPDFRPHIVGLSSDILLHQACPQDMEIFLCTLEQLFHCKALISSDLLAMNRYGEQGEEEISCYTYNQAQDPLIGRLSGILQNALLFLRDYRVCEATQTCMTFVKHVLNESHKVLLLLGQWCTAYIARIVIKEISKLEKKCTEDSNLLVLQFCRTQMNLIINLSEQEKLVEGGEDIKLSDLTTKLLFHMSMHLKLGYQEIDTHHTTTSSRAGQSCHNAKLQPMCASSKQSPELETTDTVASGQSQNSCQAPSQSANLKKPSYGTHNQCNDPLCVVLVPSTIIAKALNSLINKLSKTMPEYSFLRSACVHGGKTNQGMAQQSFTGEMEDNVMECVQDGSVNVLVATFEIEQELYARRCSLLIRLGMPKVYEDYFRVKSKLKSAGAKLVVLVRENEMDKTQESYKVFQKIEKILTERCPNSRPPCHAIKKLFQDVLLDVYEPYGEGGPRVDLLSSISLVNSYCTKFPSSGVGATVPVCRRKEVWSDNNVEFVTMLFLPRNSPIYQPIKGSVTLKRTEVNKETARKAGIKSEMVTALEACRLLHREGELSDELQPVYRFPISSLTAESEACDCEVADSGIGMDGSVKRNRAYNRKFPSILEDNFPVCGEPSYVYSITMELTKPWTFERAIRSQSKAQSTSATTLGIVSRKPLPKLPGMVIFDRSGEVTVTVTESSPDPVVLTSDQVSLLQRFTGYVFREIAKPTKDCPSTFPTFDPTIASSGYYVSLLKDAPDSCSSPFNHHKEIAFDFMDSIEDALGSFDNPTDPPSPGITDPEIFRDAVVTAIYHEKRSHYYVADICYDRSPADPFPNTEAASTFAEYYQIRYAVEVSLEQPMLDVDHTSSRLNFLIPRYQNIKGQHLSVPEKDSKRSQKSKVFVIPELCSIHPVPGYLWRQLFNLPAVLYRVESLLVAEELRCRIARGLGMGAVDWPSDVPLPLLTIGEMVGEEIVGEMVSEEIMRETDSTEEESTDKSSSKIAAEKNPTSLLSTELSDALTGLQISRQEEHSEIVHADSQLPLQDSTAHVAASSVSKIISDRSLVEGTSTETDDKPLSFPASSDISHHLRDSSQSELFNRNASVPLEHSGVIPGDHSKATEEMESAVSPITIWTDPRISSLYQTSGPASTLILRALTTGMAGDVFSLERLEILGDSFVKYAITSSIFFKHRYENEGKLSFMRGLKVSNRQLFYLARQQGMPSYVFTQMFIPLINWLPPGFYLEHGSDRETSGDSQLLLMPDKDPQEFDDDEEDGSIFAEEETPGPDVDPHSQGPSGEGHSSDIQLNPYLHHCCSDKAIADTTEALIGAYLLCFGSEGAFRFLEWLGVELTKQEQTQDEYIVDKPATKDSVLGEVVAESDSTEVVLELDSIEVVSKSDSSKVVSESDSTLSIQDISKAPLQACKTFHENLFQSEETAIPIPSISGFLSHHRSTAAEFKTLEEALNYRFCDKSLLLQAFTHTSLPRDLNSVRSSYEQLEFLGDALLDFLVTRHLYSYQKHMPPGELTDLRSAVVNNYSFAVLAIQLGFPKHLRSFSPQLFSIVNKFAEKLKEKEMKQQQVKSDEIYSSVFVMRSEGDEDAVQVEVPKALGDLFEAVAGAVYVDCGQDLDRVWQVYLPILKPSIDFYSAHPPMSAIRKLLEMMPNAAKFSPVERMVDGKFKCTLTVSGCGTFVATGRNFRIAKSTTAQRALNALQQREVRTRGDNT